SRFGSDHSVRLFLRNLSGRRKCTRVFTRSNWLRMNMGEIPGWAANPVGWSFRKPPKAAVRNPYSRKVVMDSGIAPRAPRNDEHQLSGCRGEAIVTGAQRQIDGLVAVSRDVG